MLLATREFLLIMGLGFIVSGLTTYIITFIVVHVHLRDKHPQERARLGALLISPRILWWYLVGQYRRLGDRSLNALAVLGAIGGWVIIAGIVAVAVSALMGKMGIGA